MCLALHANLQTHAAILPCLSHYASRLQYWTSHFLFRTCELRRASDGFQSFCVSNFVLYVYIFTHTTHRLWLLADIMDGPRWRACAGACFLKVVAADFIQSLSLFKKTVTGVLRLEHISLRRGRPKDRLYRSRRTMNRSECPWWRFGCSSEIRAHLRIRWLPVYGLRIHAIIGIWSQTLNLILVCRDGSFTRRHRVSMGLCQVQYFYARVVA